MIPKDAPKQDWSMYYHDTYMAHKVYGPCRITVQSTESGNKKLYASKINDKVRLSDPKQVYAKDLRILWPRPGAYNFFRYSGAGFIGRMPVRHMKRSAYRDHYYVQWAPIGLDANYMMCQISVEPVYLSIERFMEELNKPKGMRSAALSNKVILYRPTVGSPISIVYMGEEVGLLNKADELIAHMPHDSRLPRIFRHLKTVGIS